MKLLQFRTNFDACSEQGGDPCGDGKRVHGSGSDAETGVRVAGGRGSVEVAQIISEVQPLAA